MNAFISGQALEKAGGKEFQLEIKDILTCNGQLDVSTGKLFIYLNLFLF